MKKYSFRVKLAMAIFILVGFIIVFASLAALVVLLALDPIAATIVIIFLGTLFGLLWSAKVLIEEL